MKNNKRQSLDKYIEEKGMFSIIEDNKYKCDACYSELCYNPKQGLKVFNKHLQTQKHQDNMLAKENQSKFKTEDLNYKLVRWMLACNIPFALLEKEVFTEFLESLAGKKICSRSTISKNMLQDMYKIEKDKMIEIIRGKKILHYGR